ncbi:MAG: hypothetical protein TREMPRED_002152 [Tremellales sp. Tagirdzhanova-0007]|nr:MAG: hypothetical protein TREMPRED_002152 [Tremellales sp. Tagirdzhanova-0007]
MSSPTTSITPLPNSPNSNADVDTLVASLRSSLLSSQTLLESQANRLATVHDLETDLLKSRDQLTFLTAAKEAVESQLKEEARKREIAEETVELLRGQVETARRGLGILQKQDKDRKRMSTLPIGAQSLAMGDEDVDIEKEREREVKLVKRQSMLNRSHRRVSSQSEVESGSTPYASPNLGAPPPARSAGLRELRLGQVPAGPIQVTSPSASITALSDEPVTVTAAPIMIQSTSSMSNTSLNKGDVPVQEELARLKGEMIALKSSLAVSEEARVASEICLKALREFMAGGAKNDSSVLSESSTSTAELLKGLRLPPLPTDRDTEEFEPESSGEKMKDKKSSQAGWGFKLWKQPPVSPALSTSVEPPATPHMNLSPPAGPTPRVSPGLGLGLGVGVGPGEAPTESEIAALPGASTPLTAFVHGWTKSVSPGTPASGEAGSGPSPSSMTRPTSKARGISGFFMKKKLDNDGVGVGIGEKEKELPVAPVDLAGGGLEPSPDIPEKDGKRSSQSTQETLSSTLEDEVETPVSRNEISLNEESELEVNDARGDQ